MELINEHEVLAKDPLTDKMNIRFYLSATPDKNWTTVFNRLPSKHKILSLESSKVILLSIDRLEYEKNEFLSEVLYKVKKADSEVSSDKIKANIYTTTLVPGVVAVHDGLLYEGEESELKIFLQQIVNNYTNQ